MNSAELSPTLRVLGPAAAALILAMSLSGCVSTEQKATWKSIVSGRIIASQQRVMVRRGGQELKVSEVSLLQGHGRLAFAVTLRNLTDHPVNDVPLSIGVREDGRLRYLNDAPGLDYFSTHLAAVGPRATVTWVYTRGAKRLLRGRPFAVAGPVPARPIAVAHQLPAVSAQLAGTRAAGNGYALRVRVRNLSSIPQPQLQLVAVAMADGRPAAAGHATVTALDGGRTKLAGIRLVGRPGGTLELEAMPTLFG